MCWGLFRSLKVKLKNIKRNSIKSQLNSGKYEIKIGVKFGFLRYLIANRKNVYLNIRGRG